MIVVRVPCKSCSGSGFSDGVNRKPPCELPSGVTPCNSCLGAGVLQGAACDHLQISESGQRSVNGGDWVDVEAFICAFPDNDPGRFVDAPTWLLKMVGGGTLVHPERDCQACPAFKLSAAAESDAE